MFSHSCIPEDVFANQVSSALPRSLSLNSGWGWISKFLSSKEYERWSIWYVILILDFDNKFDRSLEVRKSLSRTACYTLLRLILGYLENSGHCDFGSLAQATTRHNSQAESGDGTSIPSLIYIGS